MEWTMRFLVMFLSLLGLYRLVIRRFAVRPEFVPLIANCSVGLLLFLAGILNLMRHLWIGLFWLGLIGLVYDILCVIKYRERDWIKKNGKLFFFFAIACYFAIVLRGVLCVHIDGNGHWQPIAKYLLIYEQFPTDANPATPFSSYPPGSACFIYYLCKVIGTSDACMCFAQAFLILSGLFTLTAFVDKKKAYLVPVLLGGCIYMLVGNIVISELLVDTLLPVVCLGGLAIALYHREEPGTAALLTCPISIYLITIKSGGLFYFLMIFLFCVFYSIRKGKWRSFCKLPLWLSLGTPLLMLFLWQRYVRCAFAQGATSRHALSVENITSHLTGKTQDFLLKTAQDFAKQAFSFSSPGIWLLLLAFGVLLMGWLLNRSKGKPGQVSVEPLIGCLILGSFCFYQLCLLGTYLATFDSTADSVSFGSYERYNASGILLLYGVLLLYVLVFFPKPRKQGWTGWAGLLLVTVAMLCPIVPNSSRLCILTGQYDQIYTFRYRLEQLKTECEIPYERRYFIYVADFSDFMKQDASTGTDNSMGKGEAYMTVLYALDAIDANFATRETLAQDKKALAWSDYAIVFNHDEAIDAVLTENGFPVNQTAFSIRSDGEASSDSE